MFFLNYIIDSSLQVRKVFHLIHHFHIAFHHRENNPNCTDSLLDSYFKRKLTGHFTEVSSLYTPFTKNTAFSTLGSTV